MKKILLGLSFLGLATVAKSQYYYAVSPCYDSIYEMNITTGAITASSALTSDSGAYNGVTALAENPNDGKMYTVINEGGGVFYLAELTTATSSMVHVMDLPDKFAGLTFSPSGTGYLISGDGASTPAYLYQIDFVGDSLIPLVDLDPTVGYADGEAIGFNSTDGLIYRITGSDSLQTINPSTYATMNYGFSHSLQNWGHALFYRSSTNDFLMVSGDTTYTLGLTGAVSNPVINDLGADCGVKGLGGPISTVSIAVQNEANINLYPNPSNGALTIAGEKNITNIKVISMTGALVLNNGVNNLNQATINIEKAGSYVIEITLEDDSKSFHNVIIK